MSEFFRNLTTALAGNPPLAVALGFCGVFFTLLAIAIVRYRAVEDVIKLWGAIGVPLSALLSAITAYYFAEQKHQTALAHGREQVAAVSAALKESRTAGEQLRADKHRLERELGVVVAERRTAAEQAAEAGRELVALQERHRAIADQARRLETDLVAARAEQRRLGQEAAVFAQRFGVADGARLALERRLPEQDAKIQAALAAAVRLSEMERGEDDTARPAGGRIELRAARPAAAGR